MAFASINTPPLSYKYNTLSYKYNTLIEWDPDLFFTPADSAPINNVPLFQAYTFSAIVSDGQWTSSIDAWMTALGYPSFRGYHRFPKEIIVLIYQAAMRGKRMRLFAYRVFLANLLKHPLEFTLPYFPDDELEDYSTSSSGIYGRVEE